jgi:glucan 1,3-beta-glucosidase
MPEGGSGTIMGDLSFTGGKYGINMNNQQYNVKSSTFNGCNVGIYVSHCFDCVFQGLDFVNCGTAINSTCYPISLV